MQVSIDTLLRSDLGFRDRIITTIATQHYSAQRMIAEAQGSIPRIASRMATLYSDLSTVSVNPRSAAEMLLNALQAEGITASEFAEILDKVNFGLLRVDFIERAKKYQQVCTTVNVTVNMDQQQQQRQQLPPPPPATMTSGGFSVVERRRQVDLAAEFGERGQRVLVIKVPKSFNFDPKADYVEMQNVGTLGIYEDWEHAETEVSNIFGEEAEKAGGEHNVPHYYILAPLNGGVIGAEKRQFKSKLLTSKAAARRGARGGSSVQARVQVSSSRLRREDADEEMEGEEP